MYYRRRQELSIYKKLDGITRLYVSGVYYNKAENRYHRCWRNKSSSYIKKHCNRKFRRTNKELCGKNNTYRKATEFWWEYL